MHQAHDLERGRKEAEKLRTELRHHMDAYGRQFDKIRDQVNMPDQQQQQQQQQQPEPKKENCIDDKIEKELSDIRAQIEDAKRKLGDVSLLRLSLAAGKSPLSQKQYPLPTSRKYNINSMNL